MEKGKSYAERHNVRVDESGVLDSVIWKCNKSITDLYGDVIFTKGLVYEKVKAETYPMMLIDNNVEESEVINLKDHFTPIFGL